MPQPEFKPWPKIGRLGAGSGNETTLLAEGGELMTYSAFADSHFAKLPPRLRQHRQECQSVHKTVLKRMAAFMQEHGEKAPLANPMELRRLCRIDLGIEGLLNRWILQPLLAAILNKLLELLLAWLQSQIDSRTTLNIYGHDYGDSLLRPYLEDMG